MPRRCLHGVHRLLGKQLFDRPWLCLGAACTGCIIGVKIAAVRSLLCLGAACTGCIKSVVPPLKKFLLCLGAACTGCIAAPTPPVRYAPHCLGAACTGCICYLQTIFTIYQSLPRRCLHGVHHARNTPSTRKMALPRRCLHGVHPPYRFTPEYAGNFASALPARGASNIPYSKFTVKDFASALPARGASRHGDSLGQRHGLCLGAACTGCIGGEQAWPSR